MYFRPPTLQTVHSVLLYSLFLADLGSNTPETRQIADDVISVTRLQHGGIYTHAPSFAELVRNKDISS